MQKNCLEIKILRFGNYSAPTGRIIIAWGNAPGAGVYDVKALKGRIKIGSQGAALGFNKAPFQG
ncbi:MAG: hypothetical protein DRR19_00550 [Candidatus Parabeggiatoa sp. nov. 1]|nr:MAG: hypothetical protein DRR19_00550 [Gammaproteobacteria bacterium]